MVTKKQQEKSIGPITRSDATVRRDCATRRGLELLVDQWSMLVLVALGDETRRFSQIQAQIEGISRKMLTQSLRALERNGLVKRVVYPVIPPMVEYSVTPLGLTLAGPLYALRDWSEQHIDEVERKRAEYDQQEKTLLQEDIIALVRQRAAN